MLDILRQRRSVRKFLDTPVEQEKISQLIEAVLRSPSSRGRNPWEFIVVTEPMLLKQLGAAKEHGSAFLAEAPLAIVVAADPEKCDVWVEDCSIAAIIAQLTSTALGLASCWAQIRLRSHGQGVSADAYVKSLLGLPSSYMVDCIIGIGYPAENKPGHSRDSLHDQQVHFNGFGKKA
ncbi:MAG: nitroreductase family protein [Deltaproteobacteria bacterium]|nr:nitroreductase family protein [Deltaproteobacteria bacterium]MBW2505267.1 nitroreductase family protein [Deltaproteobacteria bacterium]MBW2520338.1 nitroreductase family protein [Deltaproteobacteria bacterium]